MNLQELFSTKERELIINYLLDNPNVEINMYQIAKKLKISRSQVHKYVSILRRENIVKGKKFLNMPLINSLRLTRNLNKINEFNIVKILQKYFPRAEGIGIYGSWAKGTNDESADLDFWIKMQNLQKILKLQKRAARLSKKLASQLI